uniref:Uncharacterized protein n=1 Tax=Plectus sambesii TaxID=2011161 RepID=A0A914X693_9BILA
MGLTAMNRAMAGFKVGRPELAQPRPPPPPFISQGGPQRPPFFAQMRPMMPRAPGSFKELVEQRAADLGVPFVPQPNRFREGKPVFWFGKVSVYIDQNVIFALNLGTNTWEPMGLDHLLQVCQ